MKKIILFVIVLIFSLSACAKSPSQVEPDLYPPIAETYYAGQNIDFPPDNIYTTTAEENGLEGEIYKINGSVEDIQYDEESDFSWIFLDTDKGKVAIGNPVNYLIVGFIDEEKCRSYFSEPDIGDYVCFFAEYTGYSNLFDCAAFIYGGSDYMYDAMTLSMSEDDNTDDIQEDSILDSDNSNDSEVDQSIGSNVEYELESEPEQSESEQTDSESIPETEHESGSESEPEEDPELDNETGQETGSIFDNETAPESSMTASQQNALQTAKDYLSFMAFSYSGLIGQLEHEGFSTEDATFAADNCGADWSQQALASAKSYLDYTAFSYSGLINQLEYEGFTIDQATYAVDNCGADWNEQAAKSAENYLSISAFSREELINQLEYEGFTAEQAAFGADANGL